MPPKEFALKYFQEENDNLFALITVDQWLEFANQYHLQKIEQSYKKAHDYIYTDAEILCANGPTYSDSGLTYAAAIEAAKIASGITIEQLSTLSKEYE